MARYTNRRRSPLARYAVPLLAIAGVLGLGWGIFAYFQRGSTTAAATPREMSLGTQSNPPTANKPPHAPATREPAKASPQIAGQPPKPAPPAPTAAPREQVLTPRVDPQSVQAASITPESPTSAPGLAFRTPTSQPAAPGPGASPSAGNLAALVAGAQATSAPTGPSPQVAEKPRTTPTLPRGAASGTLESARRKVTEGRLIEARSELAAALRNSDDREIRAELGRIADRTVFSKERFENDPLVASHKMAPGHVLAKLAKQYKTPHEAMLAINEIKDPRRIRDGQIIKIPNGPFNVRIYKSQFRLDLYLQDTFVRSYPVGLGADNGTPEGTWQVDNRLTNPTYYPPASSQHKRIIRPDDPKNPLGEYWIGLKGLTGQAAGQEGFGIHGTIEPDSIGKAASAGCVRMRNEDVEYVYKLLMPGHSTVTTLP